MNTDFNPYPADPSDDWKLLKRYCAFFPTCWFFFGKESKIRNFQLAQNHGRNRAFRTFFALAITSYIGLLKYIMRCIRMSRHHMQNSDGAIGVTPKFTRFFQHSSQFSEHCASCGVVTPASKLRVSPRSIEQSNEFCDRNIARGSGDVKRILPPHPH